jgi:hypothetical protein
VKTIESACPEQSEQTPSQGLGPCTPDRVISFLYNRLNDLDVEELRFLARCSEQASFMAGQLGDTVSGIGCLVDWDDQPGKMFSGNFRDGEAVSKLLFMIADHVRIIGEMANIGYDASFSLAQKGERHV